MKINNQPIRIAHIVGKWLGGGVEAVVMNYYRNIDIKKYQFDFICDEDSTNIPYDEIKELGGRVIIIPPYQKAFKYQKELKKVLKEGNYKIVHSHINTLSVFSLFAAKRAKVPVRIAHSHSTTNPQETKKNLLKQILKPFSKIFATDYMSCSEFAGRWLFGNKTYDKGKVFVLKNAIDIKKFEYSEKVRKKYREEFNISEDTLAIGHVGRFNKTKNHEYLIDIFNEVHKINPNSVLFLVGQGSLTKTIKEKVHNLKLDESVKFLGQVDNVYDIYQLLDVFVFPSLYEGLGMVLIEAQCSGLYSIASNMVPTEVKITDNIEFLPLDGEINDWVNAILNMPQNKRKNNSKQLTKNGYNIKKAHKVLEKKYTELINRGK